MNFHSFIWIYESLFHFLSTLLLCRLGRERERVFLLPVRLACSEHTHNNDWWWSNHFYDDSFLILFGFIRFGFLHFFIRSRSSQITRSFRLFIRTLNQQKVNFTVWRAPHIANTSRHTRTHTQIQTHIIDSLESIQSICNIQNQCFNMVLLKFSHFFRFFTYIDLFRIYHLRKNRKNSMFSWWYILKMLRIILSSSSNLQHTKSNQINTKQNERQKRITLYLRSCIYYI